MTIILETHTKPSIGNFKIDMKVSYDIAISAEDARKLTGSWARETITMLMRATDATFVVSDRPIWRVPIEITFPVPNGIFDVTTVDVDAQTGEIIDPTASEQRIRDLLETKVRPLAPTKAARFELIQN